jgi:hypothetical protein
MLFPRKPAERGAAVFIDRAGSQAIVVAMHYNGVGGFLFEDEQPTVVAAPIESPVLGTTILAALCRTEVRPETSHRDSKKSAWPAYRASGSKSIRAFEAEYLRLQVRGANTANVTYVIEGRPSESSELSVCASVTSHAEPMAVTAQCLRVWRACRDRSLAP